MLDETSTPVRIAVLDAKAVSLYRSEGGRLKLEQVLSISHARSWPRDLRGRLSSGQGSPARCLSSRRCMPHYGWQNGSELQQSDDPWPIGAAGQDTNVSPSTGAAKGLLMTAATRAFFGSSRSYFTGALTPPAGTMTTVPKFYSAAFVRHDQSPIWLFASVDGNVHVVDGATDRSAKWSWGSNLAGIRTSCGAGSQVLATGPTDDDNDSVRAFEFPDRDPVAVTASTDFSGPISALWTEPRGDTAVAIAKNQETGNYEAFRLALVCSQ